MPLTPVYEVARMPSPAAARFIFATNAFSPPASQRASSRATLLPDGTIISSSSRRWVYSRPASTGAVVSTEEYDSSAARRSATTVAPGASASIGWLFRIT